MRILQLCKKFPWPLNDGESIAVTYLARALHAEGCKITLLSMNTRKHWYDLNHLPPEFDHYSAVYTVEVDNRIRPWSAFWNLFSRKSYHISRFESEAFAQRLEELLKACAYDLIQLESVYLAPYLPLIRRMSKAPVVLRAHNVEHEIWLRVSRNSAWLKRAYLQLITPRLRDYELKVINDFDLVAAISERDARRFRALGLSKPSVVCPIGMEVARYVPDEACFSAYPALSFIGTLDWMPNQEGLMWFLEQVWLPWLQPRFPHLKFHVAGRNAPSWMRRIAAPGVVFHGEVADAAAFLNQYPIMVAPLLSGGGMRAKILEAMALGRVVVSTAVGIEGIEAANGVEALVADRPADFAQAIADCVQNEAKLRSIGAAARKFCVEQFDHLTVSRRLMQAYRGLEVANAAPDAAALGAC